MGIMGPDNNRRMTMQQIRILRVKNATDKDCEMLGLLDSMSYLQIL